MQPSPRVTVLMTLYNKGPYVAEAIQSVLDQSYGDFELLVVDDGSKDEGPDTVSAFSDQRIRLLASDLNTGRAGAANRGLETARGEFVAILDADDRMHSERLGKQVAFMDAQPEVDVLGTAARTFGQGTVTAQWPADDAACQARLPFEDPVLFGSAMIRRSSLERHGLRCDPHWQGPGMDYLFQVAMASKLRFANLPEVLTEYRIGPNNLRHGRDAVADRERIIRRAFELMGWPIGAEEARLHRHLVTPVPCRLSAADVHALHAWCARLQHWVKERGDVPVQQFRRELEERWSRLFHHLADRGFEEGWAHLRRSGTFDIGRLWYLIKVRAKAGLGRGTGAKPK